jgi:hypothetical protein
MAKKPPAKRPSRQADSAAEKEPSTLPTDITPRFKLVFITAAILTFAFFAGGLILASRETSTPAAEKAVAACFTMATMGFGAIVGLIGGKVA